MPQRQLNIELLRIFSMFLITLGHVKVHFMKGFDSSVSMIFMNYVTWFILFHVNLFILITGYFGIRNCKKPLLKTLLLLYFYSIILNVISWIINGQFDMLETFLPVSHGPWWFMTMYVVMLMLGPIIEYFAKDCSLKKVNTMALGAMFINMYLGHYMHIVHIYDEGFGIVNFVSIYILGVWIRKEGELLIRQLRHPLTTILFAIFVLMALQYKSMPFFSWNDMTEYCGPYSTFMAVLVFFLFANITVPEYFRKVVMFFSSSAIAAYLITDHGAIREMLKPLFKAWYLPYQNSIIGIAIIFMSVAIAYITCCLIDKVRIPITNYLAKKIMNISIWQ